MAHPDFIEAQKYLSGMDYPAGKQEIVEHARSRGADEETLRELERIPDREYDGPNAVSEALAST
jgi:hypothetical protein